MRLGAKPNRHLVRGFKCITAQERPSRSSMAHGDIHGDAQLSVPTRQGVSTCGTPRVPLRQKSIGTHEWSLHMVPKVAIELGQLPMENA